MSIVYELHCFSETFFLALKIKGQVPVFYKEGPKDGKTEWPPRFMKVENVFAPFLTQLLIY